MAMKTESAQVLGQAYGSVAMSEYSRVQAAYAGYSGGSTYYGYVLKFAAPAFSGVSEGLRVGLWASLGWGENVTLRYALCTSDENRGLYIGTTEAVEDTNQIAAGTVELTEMDDMALKAFSIPTTKVKSGQTYYLFLWASGDTGVSVGAVENAWGAHTVEVGYNQGAVRVIVDGRDKLYAPGVVIGGKLVRMRPLLMTKDGPVDCN